MRKIAQLDHIRLGQPSQVELIGCCLPEMDQLRPQPITFGLAVLVDEAESFQGREVAMYLGLGFPKLVCQRGQAHRLGGGRQRLQYLSRGND